MKNEEFNKRLGFEMRNQRLLKRLTLEDVAARMGYMSRNSISYMELGNKAITVEDLMSYCDAVGCSWIEIMEKVEG